MMMQSGLLGIFAITTPIFLIVAIGYVVVRLGFVPKEGVRAMAAFLVNVAVPALLFQAIGSRDLAAVLQSGFLLVYGGGSLIAFTTIFVVSTTQLGRRMTGGAIYGIGSGQSNTLMIGFPIASAMAGTAAVAPFAMVLLIENLLMLPLALILADLGRDEDRRLGRIVARIAPALLKNPVILGILLGVLVSLTGITVPPMLDQTLGYLSRTVTGLGLFVVGGMLVGFKYRGNLRDVTIVVLAKLLLHPGVILLLFLVVPGVPQNMVVAGVVMAAAPMFGIYAAIGERYGLGPMAAAVLAPATIFSYFSIGLMIFLTSIVWGGQGTPAQKAEAPTSLQVK